MSRLSETPLTFQPRKAAFPQDGTSSKLLTYGRGRIFAGQPLAVRPPHWSPDGSSTPKVCSLVECLGLKSQRGDA